MSPLIWIQPANLAGFFFCPAFASASHARGAQNLYDTARYVMMGLAFNSDFDTRYRRHREMIGDEVREDEPGRVGIRRRQAGARRRERTGQTQRRVDWHGCERAW